MKRVDIGTYHIQHRKNKVRNWQIFEYTIEIQKTSLRISERYRMVPTGVKNRFTGVTIDRAFEIIFKNVRVNECQAPDV